ncbi:MAG: GNAT family N-acetyltransferase [Defluviitaleaceae bacterium]|nr:GNAT family N-acetyltransferase [Defluviitaleaceae bacterium]
MHIYETMENGIKIVEYDPSLNATLADMWNKSKDDWGGGNDTKTPGQVATRIDGGSCIHHYVAMDGEEAVGYCSLSRYFGDADALYIELLGVRPDYQGKKVGKALVLRCVNRTIELGYPRLDIHTWPGNTNAVPLYKKCGYLWEERADSTHLVNFIPEILDTGLFKPFFEKADWYADSTRDWSIKPDEVKENKFGVFGYTWKKDGDSLSVGYERTGRRMRLIETDDYKIEMMAENHELAFGLSYDCKFTVTNKIGKDLHVKINGRDDKNIRFDYAIDEHVTGTREYPARFFVGEVNELQNKWAVHPCVLADVVINNQAVTFGLGINAKYPLEVDASMEAKVMQAGMEVSAFINIRSALLKDATVRFSFPKNDLLSFKENSFTANIPAGGKANIPTTVKILSVGYDPMPVRYDITLADGTALSFEKPFNQCNQDLTHAFSCENDVEYKIINGPWGVCLGKQDNDAWMYHLTNPELNDGFFESPKLGKPYDDEFNLIKPAVRMFPRGTDMVMKAEFVSQKFAGMVLTMVFTLSAAGVITRSYRIENRGTAPRETFLNDSYWLALGGHTVFKYKGQITQNYNTPPDGPHFGIDALDPEGFEENWLFEANPAGCRGFCWSPDLKPGLQWGRKAIFEVNAGMLEPGQTFETPPFVMAYGLFNNFGEFRNYAMRLWDKKNHIPARRVEVRLNGYNPFIVSGREVSLDILNNRETTLEGTIRVSSDLFETLSIVNEESDDPTVENNLTLKFDKNPAELARINVDMALSTYEKSYSRILFTTTSAQIERKSEGTVYTVDNGKIAFRADPSYGPVCYSLTTPDGSEWLLNQYPEHKPFAWWNPFLGGIRVIHSHLNNVAILKEETKVYFTEVKDNHGNLWQGLRVTLTFKEDDELRGASYEAYYVTMPGLPMLCTFYRFNNGSGTYRRDTLEWDAFLSPADEGKGFYAEASDKNGQTHRLRYGSGGDMGIKFENMLKLTGERAKKLYIFHGNKNNGKNNEVGGDVKFPAAVSVYMEAAVAPGKTFTSSPMFFLFTGDDLNNSDLDDLERLTFDGL